MKKKQAAAAVENAKQAVPKKTRGKIATWLSEELDKFYTLLAAKKKLLIFLALWSIGLNYLLEVSLRKNFLLGFIHIFAQPLVFAYNSLLIFTFFSILLVIKRRLFGFTVLNVVFLTLAITDYVVLLSRNTPLNAPDFRIIKSAFGVVTIYLNIFEQIFKGGCK